MKKHNFDGLDLDWEYPKCWQVDCKTGPASDKKAFADWVQELSKALKKEGIYIRISTKKPKLFGMQI